MIRIAGSAAHLLCDIDSFERFRLLMVLKSFGGSAISFATAAALGG